VRLKKQKKSYKTSKGDIKMERKDCILGGIIRYNDGVGFKIIFNDSQLANYYKNMLQYILKSDGFNVTNKKAYYDTKEE